MFGIGLPELIILFFIANIIALILAIIKGSKAEKFKTLIFAMSFYEYLGWIICISLIGIPIGLTMVLTAQCVRLFIEIEKNTAGSKKLLEELKK